MSHILQGIDYSKPNIQHSTPQFDKITIDLDRIDRIEKKIAYYESFCVLWDKWQHKMTPRETDVFHKRYMQDKAVVDISAELQASNVRIYGLIGQLEAKYEEFTKENSQYLQSKCNKNDIILFECEIRRISNEILWMLSNA